MDDIQVLEDWLDTPTVAERLGVTRGRVWQMVKAGAFPAEKVRQVGGNIVIAADIIAEMQRSRDLT